ncbi:reverse transcriptase domain-containing protein [Tanacetum coccineum]
MTRISRTITVAGKPFNTEHKLNEYKHIKPIKQKKHGLGHDRNEAACKEVDDVTQAGILGEVKDQTWVANPVMVKKSDEEVTSFLQSTQELYRQENYKMDSRFRRSFLKDKEIHGNLTNTYCPNQRGKLNYPLLEKLILALVHAARRLRRYFQAHPIRILIVAPIKQTFECPEKSGRIAKWAIELGEHDIEFRGCDSIKKQIPNDFLIKTPSEVDDKIKTSKLETKKEGLHSESIWKLYIDGASSSGRWIDVDQPQGNEIHVRFAVQI